MTISVIGDNTGDDFAGTEDTELRGTTNNGSVTTINITNHGTAADERTGIIKFSGLSNIPSSATVSAITFGQYLSLKQAEQGQTLAVQRCLRNWVESEAASDVYSTGNSWTTDRGLSDGNDRSATLSATLTYTASGYQLLTDAGLVTDIQNFVDGGQPNYGWVQQLSNQTTDLTDIHRFISSEGTDGQRPYLTVTYTAGAAFQAYWAQQTILLGGGFR